VVFLALPVLATSWVQPINTTINIMIGSSIDPTGGTIAAINYADRLYVIAASVFAISVTNYIFPKLSQLIANGNEKEWGQVIRTAVKSVILIVVPVAALFMVESRDIVRVIYERGQFGDKSAHITSIILSCYSFGMVGYAVQEVFNKAFFSKQNKKIPMIIAVGTILCNITLCILLSKIAGVFGFSRAFGLSIAVSISSILFAIISGFFIRKQMAENTFQGFGRELIQIGVMAVITVLVAYGTKVLCYQYIASTNLISHVIILMIPACVGMLSYILMAFILRIDEIKYIKKLLRR